MAIGRARSSPLEGAADFRPTIIWTDYAVNGPGTGPEGGQCEATDNDSIGVLSCFMLGTLALRVRCPRRRHRGASRVPRDSDPRRPGASVRGQRPDPTVVDRELVGLRHYGDRHQRRRELEGPMVAQAGEETKPKRTRRPGSGSTVTTLPPTDPSRHGAGLGPPHRLLPGMVGDPACGRETDPLADHSSRRRHSVSIIEGASSVGPSR